MSAILGADSYGVRHEFETAVRTTVVDGGTGEPPAAGTHSQYHWGEMTYNSSVVGEVGRLGRVRSAKCLWLLCRSPMFLRLLGLLLSYLP